MEVRKIIRKTRHLHVLSLDGKYKIRKGHLISVWYNITNEQYYAIAVANAVDVEIN
ncbi:MAG: hypothetical protein ACMUEM_03425 [Flavobacteriales bacterium AspAUS03]